MTKEEHYARAQYLVGWLVGFAPCVWLLSEARGADGHPLVSDEACAQYERVVTELAGLLGVKEVKG